MAVHLVLAIVGTDEASPLTAALAARGLQSTRLASTGGFLREGNATLLIGCAEERVEEVLVVIRRICRVRVRVLEPLAYLDEVIDPTAGEPVEVSKGGATAFVMALERFERV